MANKQTLHDKNNNDIYPITLTNAIIDSKGNLLSDYIDIINKYQNKLDVLLNEINEIESKLLPTIVPDTDNAPSVPSVPETPSNPYDDSYIIYNGKFVNSDIYGSSCGSYITQNQDHIAVKAGYSMKYYESFSKQLDLSLTGYNTIVMNVAFTGADSCSLALATSDVPFSLTSSWGVTSGVIWSETDLVFALKSSIGFKEIKIPIEFVDVELYYGFVTYGLVGTNGEGYFKIESMRLVRE